MIGGGNFIDGNDKILPGAYVNFVSGDEDALSGSGADNTTVLPSVQDSGVVLFMIGTVICTMAPLITEGFREDVSISGSASVGAGTAATNLYEIATAD